MEPIRPDHDEVAARNSDKEMRTPAASKGDKSAVSAQLRGPGHAGKGAVGGAIPVILLAILVLIGGWLLVSQHQTIEQLQADVAEADDWISRTKLSMARFEGRLSEADRELLESGSEITEKLAFLDSEMRKLWGVSNDRNRKAIKANQDAVAFLEDKTDYLDKQRAELSGLVADQQSNHESAMAAIDTLRSSLRDVAARQAKLVEEVEQNSALAGAVVETQKNIEARVGGLVQRQTLANDELRARLAAVEQKAAASDVQATLSQLNARLSELNEVVDSIDASRSQITGRLLRLEQRIQSVGEQ
ncbi:hypothetical protein [Hydrocarboniclastica marina]|uniref:Uncharacterized protein n=1 Tax=Hydrocarboniclastica marina TaxID=2259620 RepID=A0A4P7XI83_9ALTE|nr:hypothetical protein [Hydrocarboniclastica marina]QCF26413.1 hypothetical protein soil367_10955 [Hydrocarboniclastica marina]